MWPLANHTIWRGIFSLQIEELVNPSESLMSEGLEKLVPEDKPVSCPAHTGLWHVAPPLPLPILPCFPYYLEGWACPTEMTGVGSLAKLIASDQGFTSLIMAVLTGTLDTQVLLKLILPKQVPGSSLLALPSYAGFSTKTLLTKTVVHHHSFTIHLPCFWHLYRENYSD